MTKYEKKTFFRFILIYLVISFLLFIVLALFYYSEQKKHAEDKLQFQMNSLSKKFSKDRHNLHKEFNFTIESSSAYESPAFIKTKEQYIYTSCGNLGNPDKILVVKADKTIIDKNLNKLQRKITIYMLFLFVINFIISIILALIALRPIKKANKEFKIFVDDIIHDINAPISSLSINAESLINSYSEKKIQRIIRSLDDIKNIYSNLESILQMEYKNTPKIINLNKFCKDIIFKFQPIFHNTDFTIDIPDIEIKIDPFLLERIVVNIIQNSVKYSDHKPKITLGIYKSNKFYIKDNGCGMDNPQILFNRSLQFSKQNKGYGLGLSIVQRLCDKSNIKIDVKSQKHKGTVFYFDLSSHIVK